MSGVGELLNITATTNYYNNSSKQKIGTVSSPTGTQVGKQKHTKKTPLSVIFGGRAAPTNKPKSWKLAE